MRPVSAVRQIATRTGITLICMGTACAFTLAQARRIQSGTEKFVRPAAKTAPASAAAVTEQGNISTLCPARSPQKAAIMAQVSAAEEEEAETYISIYGGNITATGGGFAAGIGSGFTQSAKKIRIYGGTVTAKAGMRRRRNRQRLCEYGR